MKSKKVPPTRQVRCKGSYKARPEIYIECEIDEVLKIQMNKTDKIVRT